MAAHTEINLNSLFGEQDTLIETPRDSEVRPSRGAFWDHSGTIAAANTSQLVAKENDARRYLFFQNVSTATLWINFSLAAQEQQPSIKLAPGASYESNAAFVTTESLYAISDTAAAAFVCKEA